jgi:hypothetical protein
MARFFNSLRCFAPVPQHSQTIPENAFRVLLRPWAGKECLTPPEDIAGQEALERPPLRGDAHLTSPPVRLPPRVTWARVYGASPGHDQSLTVLKYPSRSDIHKSAIQCVVPETGCASTAAAIFHESISSQM